jgi:glutamate synthase (NADPH/NADH) large chain
MGAALRELAGEMGVSEVQELVGQADRLVQVSHHDRLDLTSLLTPVRERVITSPAGTPRFFRPFHPPPPHRAPEVAAERLAAGSALAVEEESTTAADRNLGTDLAGLIARATTGVNNAWVNGADGGVSPTNPSGANGAGNGSGNGHRPTLVDLAFTKGAAAGSGLAAFTLDGVRVRVFGGAQDGVGKCALGGEIQVLKARNADGEWVGGHVGKSFAYGAQRGLFLIQGNADARAGIRLSGADMVLGGEPAAPLDDRLGTLAARANCKGFAFEYMTGGRVVVLGDPGPWLCSGMTGGVVYTRQNPEWGLDEAAVRRRLSKAAKVSLAALDEETDVPSVTGLLTAYQAALRASGQEETADGLQALIDEPAEHFIAINPVTQQADPNISTE